MSYLANTQTNKLWQNITSLAKVIIIITKAAHRLAITLIVSLLALNAMFSHSSCNADDILPISIVNNNEVRVNVLKRLSYVMQVAAS